ncbi:beta-scruin-like [Condylostylus longicornis]|uniref:beta-scruin-like n=1 Tax=Condylostylus longicornis TaxID=2530218 RepID=UPI00244DEF72|nr:beta-scruin-like [Condylostylus longicornis]
MRGARHHHSATICNNKIYVVGGTKPARGKEIPVISDTVWCFNLLTIKWSKETRLPYPRRDFGLISIENGFYVIGGESIGNIVLSSTIFYDINMKVWVKKASLKQSRSGLMVIADTSRTKIEKNEMTNKMIKSCCSEFKSIWAAGGILDTVNFIITDQIEGYNINEDIWYTIGYLRIPRCYGKFCITNNKDLYCIGGVTNIDGILLSLQDVDKYFRDTNEWKCVTKMSSSRHGHDVIALDDKIIIIGGMSIQEKKIYKSIECYSIRESRWLNNISELPSPLSGLSCLLCEDMEFKWFQDLKT